MLVLEDESVNVIRKQKSQVGFKNVLKHQLKIITNPSFYAFLFWHLSSVTWGNNTVRSSESAEGKQEVSTEMIESTEDDVASALSKT